MENKPTNTPKDLKSTQANRFTHRIYGMKIVSTSKCSFSELVKQIEDERQLVYCQSELLQNRPFYEKDLHLCLN